MCMSQEHGAATQGVGAGPDVLRINTETQRKATGENLGGWAERTQGLKPGKMAPQSLKQSSPEMTPIPSSGYFLHVVSASKCRLLFLVLLSLKHLIFFYLYMCANMCDFWSWNEGGYGPYYVGSRSQTPKLCKSSQRSSPQSHLSSPTSIFFYCGNYTYYHHINWIFLYFLFIWGHARHGTQMGIRRQLWGVSFLLHHVDLRD